MIGGSTEHPFDMQLVALFYACLPILAAFGILFADGIRTLTFGHSKHANERYQQRTGRLTTH